ncbi:hypothetical protein N7457_006160 [Penicillium paradoxum]|uniref:uncharacterized protein n=1 Tax=Penicillium paradoxum TaxID=176176 RepID=UPI002546F635|nr:uncharacterized protein N7457_006160 [Penicillium paradoxum]KAJ5781000.1 hypothetical protein N7457_006160 [Penicillium paradoxum]
MNTKFPPPEIPSSQQQSLRIPDLTINNAADRRDIRIHPRRHVQRECAADGSEQRNGFTRILRLDSTLPIQFENRRPLLREGDGLAGGGGVEEDVAGYQWNDRSCWAVYTGD